MANQFALTRYGRELNTHDLLKILAILLMIVDHLGEFLFHDNPWCRLIGRGAAPLFFFLIGYVGKLRFRPSLFLYGVILSVMGGWLSKQFWINILLTFAVIQLVLTHYPPAVLSFRARLFFFSLCVALNVVTYNYVEYGLLGLLLAYNGRLLALKDPHAENWLIATLVVYFIWESITFNFLQQAYLISFVILCAVLFFIMSSYQFRKLNCPSFLLWPALAISRYSLEIYFFHLFALQSYALLHHSI